MTQQNGDTVFRAVRDAFKEVDATVDQWGYVRPDGEAVMKEAVSRLIERVEALTDRDYAIEVLAWWARKVVRDPRYTASKLNVVP